MQDLNDLFYFAMVVEHGGFAQAGRAIGVPKSKLSRRVALLEEQLGVRLIQRSTRHFSITELGQAFFGRCKAMMEEAAAARALVEVNQTEPCGSLRLTSTTELLSGGVSRLVAEYMALYPRVSVYLKAYNRPVDVISEGFDVAIRESSGQLADSELVQRVLAKREQILVAAPFLLDQHDRPAVPADISLFPTLELTSTPGPHEWRLAQRDGSSTRVRHHPRLCSDDIETILAAVRGGSGLAILPISMVDADLKAGALCRVLKEWECPEHIVHAILPSRRHMLPSVRAFVDHLVENFATKE
ncbi:MULTISPECIES: LysR substrate-binding domain-containing protein [Stenotrophomonas]|uniref:LysR substrate-binding domain-containing protein n=1 Tax=Stenotrophomonas TaxID=40323 RepID=UPI000B6E5E49|nr:MULTISPECIES: LysR substrate-binding domain-containing protein [Stenotrophomonas]SMR83827.1 DNA-binding transcriptional regulator, LysR family [Stenotrophomonas sp. yr243]SNT66528.1 DNA-binding transcriptional regulator, LysR family [Stenotrophomonas lactitubi]